MDTFLLQNLDQNNRRIITEWTEGLLNYSFIYITSVYIAQGFKNPLFMLNINCGAMWSLTWPYDEVDSTLTTKKSRHGDVESDFRQKF